MKRSAAYLVPALGLLGVIACSSDPATPSPPADAGGAADASVSSVADGSTVTTSDAGAADASTQQDATTDDSGDGGTDAGSFPINFFAKGTWTLTPQANACNFSFTGLAAGAATPASLTDFTLSMAAKYYGRDVAFSCSLQNNAFTCQPVVGNQTVGQCDIVAALTDVTGTLMPELANPNRKASATIAGKVTVSVTGGSNCSAFSCAQAPVSGTATIK